MFSPGCASRREQGKEGAASCSGSEGWRLLICLHRLSAGTAGFAGGKRELRGPGPHLFLKTVALAWSSISPRKMAWSGLGLISHLAQLEDSSRGSR